MGCDIHMMTEVRIEGKWRRAPGTMLKCWSCDGAGKYGSRHRGDLRGKPCERCKGAGQTLEAEYWNGRNYDLFAMLADVRNGYGFAGIVTGDGFKPIAMPRGVPADASPEFLAEVEQWGVDGHSHSHHTLAQLEAYDWDNQRANQQGVISAEQYQEWREARGCPASWCGEIWGGQNITMPEAEYLRLEKAGDLPKDKKINVAVQWVETYKEAAGNQWAEETMPALRALADKHGGADNVRIVFFFDN